MHRRWTLAILAVCVAAGAGSYGFVSWRQGTDARAATTTDVDEYIAAALPLTSADQAEALSDGQVTFSEHENALTLYRQCMMERGYEVTDFVPAEGKRPTQWSFLRQPPAGQSTDVSASESQANTEDCRHQHLDDVDAVWAMQQGQPSLADLNDHFDRLEACVASGGEAAFKAPAGLVTVEYAQMPDRRIEIREDQLPAYRRCTLIVQAATGLLSPAPAIIG